MASGFGGCLKSEGFSGYVFSQVSLRKLLPPLGQTKQIRTKKTETKTKKSREPKQAKPPLRRYYYCSCDHSTFPSPSLWLFCHVRCGTAHASACHTTSTGPHSKVRSVQVNDGPHLTSLREFQEGPGQHNSHPGSLPACWFLFSPLKP